MALIVLDASVLIAHLDPDDALHEHATMALLERADDDLRLPASAYAEALVAPARAGALTTMRERVAALGLRIVAIDAAVAERAAAIRAEKVCLRLPDALVLASAHVVDADEVLTGDHRWRGLDRVHVLG